MGSTQHKCIPGLTEALNPVNDDGVCGHRNAQIVPAISGRVLHLTQLLRVNWHERELMSRE